MLVTVADNHKSVAEDIMSDFSINEMLLMQRMLQEKYKEKWEAIGQPDPTAGRGRL